MRLVVVPPKGGLGIKELGKVTGFDEAGAALDSATSKLAGGLAEKTADAAAKLAETTAEGYSPKVVGSVLEKGAGLGEHAQKKQQWFEDAFTDAIGGEIDVDVLDPDLGRTLVDCDYRLRFVAADAGGSAQAYGKLYRTTLGGHKVKGAWVLEGCADGESVASDDMKFVRTFRWWLMDPFDRYTFEMDADPVGELAADANATEAARKKHRALAADVDAWRQKGAALEAGAQIAGITPKETGDFASPVRADGTLDRWDNRVMAGELAGTAAEELTIVGLQKVTGGGKVGERVSATGGVIVGSMTEQAITKGLPADHYFGDLCEAVAYTDAAYAHRRGIDDGLERRASAGSWSAERGARRAGAGAEAWRLCGVGRRTETCTLLFVLKRSDCLAGRLNLFQHRPTVQQDNLQALWYPRKVRCDDYRRQEPLVGTQKGCTLVQSDLHFGIWHQVSLKCRPDLESISIQKKSPGRQSAQNEVTRRNATQVGSQNVPLSLKPRTSEIEAKSRT